VKIKVLAALANDRIRFRLLKKLQMRGVEERGMRHTLLYAAITSFEKNDTDGTYSKPVLKEHPSSRLRSIAVRLRYAGGHYLVAFRDTVFYFG